MILMRCNDAGNYMYEYAWKGVLHIVAGESADQAWSYSGAPPCDASYSRY